MASARLYTHNSQSVSEVGPRPLTATPGLTTSLCDVCARRVAAADLQSLGLVPASA